MAERVDDPALRSATSARAAVESSASGPHMGLEAASSADVEVGAGPHFVAAAQSSGALARDESTGASEASVAASTSSGRWQVVSRFWRRRRWRTVLESWSSSLVVHATLLVLLAMVTIAMPIERRPESLMEFLERPEESLSQRLEEQAETAALTFTPAAGAVTGASHAAPLAQDVEPQLDQRAAESVAEPAVRLADVSLLAVPSRELSDNLDASAPGDPLAPVEGYGAAMDRMAQELLLMMASGKVMLTWLFDQSESMRDDQQEFRERLERIYQELGLAGADRGDVLLTNVASFGSAFALHTARPTGQLETVREAIEQVPVDASGRENVMGAVVEAIGRSRRLGQQGRRQLVLVVVTDESGDDGEQVEAAIQAAREARCRVYVLGREAVFGCETIYTTYRHPKNNYEYWRPLRRGPESPMVEALQSDGLVQRYWALPSGFGSYELVRLCRQTGGAYFMLPSNEPGIIRGEQRIYELEAMRPYLPDLDDRTVYLEERLKQPLRAGLAEVIESLDMVKSPSLRIGDWMSIEPTEFARQAEERLGRAREWLALLELADSRLESLRAQRQREASPRWQANYDLARAQVTLFRVRAHEFGVYLQAFLKQPKLIAEPRTNFWRPEVVSAEPLSIADTRPLVEQATEQLREVIRLHPGTPYAALAEIELNRGFAVDFLEHYHPPDMDAEEANVPKF